jgi:uncharacterized protein YbjT (DUF2867 family)
MGIRPRCVFVTGGTGYLGRALIASLLDRGHRVRALVRPGSEGKLPHGCQIVFGNALNGLSYAEQIRPADTFVQLVGIPHRSRAKPAQFRSVDLASASGAVRAAANARVQHFIYVSVAQPAPVRKACIRVRAECETLVRESGLNATIVRPWYVLGPGHRWPFALLPLYRLLELFPATWAVARRLGLVTLEQMTRALVLAVENPCRGLRIVEVPEIRVPSGFSASAKVVRIA